MICLTHFSRKGKTIGTENKPAVGKVREGLSRKRHKHRGIF
jgi:hypothetical protein